MIVSNIFQMKSFCIMLFLGLLLGLIYGILNITNSIKEQLIFRIISDLLFSISYTLIFIIAINKVNLGQIRLYLIVGYIIGFVIERITLGKLFAKGYKNVYNLLIKGFNKFKQTKFGGIIFK